MIMVVNCVNCDYETSFKYCQNWLPLDNPLLKHCQFINFDER